MGDLPALSSEALERLGSFYLGRAIEDGEKSARPVLYDARDLTTHALCVGMTGSGKTGLSVVLLEEAALDGVPAIVIDPKGDLGNLFLTFPELRPQDFEPWIDPGEASRKGRTVPEHAAAVSTMWREGLARDGQDAARVARLEASVERVIFTPGSTAGRPLSVLGDLRPPPASVQSDPDAMRDEVAATASALCALLDVDADPIASAEHILLSTLLNLAWSAGSSLDLPTLVRQVIDPPIERVGALPLDDFCSPRNRKKLGMKLNHLLAAPAFAPWLEGEPLDITTLLRAPDGRPRHSVLSIAHLGESERMFFVTLLLSKLITWMRGQSGTASLRAILFMDEVFGFFPPVAEPPSKRPMLTLLKQARAYGLGVLLATQNPVDLDYKGLSNCGTWLLGRLSTERDVERVIEGLAGAGGDFDPAATRAQLAGLGSRRFLMRNVHEESPVVFETRWAMSYLRGPLTRTQIAELAGPPAPPPETPTSTPRTTPLQRPVAAPAVSAPTVSAPAASAPAASAPAVTSVAQAPAQEIAPEHARPALDPSIPERFLVPTPGPGPIEWRPAGLAAVSLHYAHRYSGLDVWLAPSVLAPLASSARGSWEARELIDPRILRVTEEPTEPGTYAEVPRFVTKKGGLGKLEKALKSALYKSEQVVVYRCEAHKAWSSPGEGPAEFIARMVQIEREDRDQEIGKLRERFEREVEKARARVEKAEDKLEREKSQVSQRRMDTAVGVGSTVLGALLGRRVLRSATSAARGASRTSREKDDVRRAESALRELEEELREREGEAREGLEALRARPVGPPAIEPRSIKPTKSDLSVDELALVWVPHRVVDGVAREAWRETRGVS